ncbi:protein-export chaperone SecB [Sphingomonas sp. VNH70]|uniref:protein-export chaperone SecB n=1 Tax=Sphingomonas silueang TaxID=3156617 RepID=UPI0032B60B11
MDEQNDAIDPQAFTGGDDGQPAVNVITQYVKDLSFENPNAPGVYQLGGQPKLDVQFNIGAGQVGEDVHEVVLKIEARAEIEGQVMYLVDLSFAGLFGLRNIPAEHLQPFLLGEAPRILFPFARRVLADAVRDGGFPPLMLEPIDFAQLYLSQAEGQGAIGEVAGHA